MKQATLESHVDPSLLDPLTDVLRSGAKTLLKKALEAEIQELLSQYNDVLTLDGKRAIVRNGYLLERAIQTGIGAIPVRVPKVRDRSFGGVKFRSSLVPPYLRRSQSMEELIPWLYLKGVSTGDFAEALSAIVGEQAVGLSPSVVCRLKQKWSEEYNQWNSRSLEHTNFVYFWADAVYFAIRGEQSSQCMLVIIGARDDGTKELVALQEGYRESSEGWSQMLRDVRERGLQAAPKLCIADGALGFWSALRDVFPYAKHQRCWQHKTANAIDKLPSSAQATARAELKNIHMAGTKEEAESAWGKFVRKYEAKHPRAVACLEKNKDEMLTFFDFPAEHWIHLRTTNVIESVFSTVRLRTVKTRNCVSQQTILSLVYKLVQSAEKRWKRLRGHSKLALVADNIQFENGIEIHQEKTLENAA